MKLFLSSVRLPSEDERITLFGTTSPLSVTLVPNAWDVYPEDRQKTVLTNTVNQFKQLGYQTSITDLATSSDQQVQSNLATSDFIWVMGGNTFYLNHLIRKTDFDRALRQVLKDGAVYGGTSAGAVVAGPTLHGTEHMDSPDQAPEVIWEGLSLVDFGIVPHWGMAKYGARLEKMRAEMQPHVSRVVTLTNEQAAVVIDGKLEIHE